MSRATLPCLSFLIFAGIVVLVSSNGCGSGASSPILHSQGKIQHVVIIVQENRTPDNLFHDTVLMNAGADIASSGVNSAGQTITLLPTTLATDYYLGNAHSDFNLMYDGGKMDGADKESAGCGNGSKTCLPPNPQFYYVQSSDAAPYFQMAEQYTFGDRMFQTNEGPSFPAHQFILSGTSAPTATSNLFAAENPEGGPGCVAQPTATVALIDPSGNESSSTYPCFDHPTLPSELDSAGVSWRFYAPGIGSIWTAPNAILQICGPNAPPPNGTACQGTEWQSNVSMETLQTPAPILTDIASNQLAAVSWVIPTGTNSDLAGSANTTGGPSWVASIVNAIGNSPYWANTAIFVVWDDWGGWYDHVAPASIIKNGTSWGSGYVYGFRVPLIVISPYAKAAYISHQVHDFGSILHFVEGTFGLSSLGYADAYADDLADCFNFSQTPLTFQTISAPMGADHFLNDHTPQVAPDVD